MTAKSPLLHTFWSILSHANRKNRCLDSTITKKTYRMTNVMSCNIQRIFEGIQNLFPPEWTTNENISCVSNRTLGAIINWYLTWEPKIGNITVQMEGDLVFFLPMITHCPHVSGMMYSKERTWGTPHFRIHWVSLHCNRSTPISKKRIHNPSTYLVIENIECRIDFTTDHQCKF